EYAGNEMLLVQYFERGRLEYHPLAAGTPGEVTISPLGRDLALLRNLETAASAAPAAAPAPVATPPPAPQPTPLPAPAAPKAAAPAPRPSLDGKHISVDLGAQWLYAYEGETLVYDAPVSTGRDGFNTPAGDFSIYAKLPMQTMSGTIGGESYY